MSVGYIILISIWMFSSKTWDLQPCNYRVTMLANNEQQGCRFNLKDAKTLERQLFKKVKSYLNKFSNNVFGNRVEPLRLMKEVNNDIFIKTEKIK